MGFIMIVFEAVGWNVWCSETALGNKGDMIFSEQLMPHECTAYCTASALTTAL